MADQNTPESFTPKPFSYSPTSGTTPGLSDSPTRSAYAQRQRPVPPVVYGNMPGLTDGVPIDTSKVVPNVAPETKPTVK